MSQLNEAMEESISNTDDLEHIVKIKANEDYTYFTFVSDNEKLSLADALIPTPYVMLGGIYSVFNGNPDAEINYEFINNDTGQVIYASDSGEEFTEATTVPPATTTTAATTTVAETTTAAPVTTENVPPETEPEAEPETDAPAEETPQNTYSNNEYYDLVEASSYKTSLGTYIINKVLAKQDISVTGSMILYAADGSVLGKATDDITLTEGRYNYFCYVFKNDVLNAESVSANAQPKRDSILPGERNAVEMVQYNQSGDELYITFEQTGDEISAFAHFKLLFYKDDKIISTKSGYFSSCTENLNGKGSTDVASIRVYKMDFDRIEYVYEP